jgi:fluoroquinolone resistance protein
VDGLTLRGEDWYGDEIVNREYTDCAFYDVDMTELVNRGSVFERCTFGNVRFNASEHTDAAFVSCTFKRCNLFDAVFQGCKLVGSVFQECTLRPMRVRGGDWSFAGLAGADLRGSRFEDVRMREIDLTRANCEKVELVDVDLTAAQTHRANFTRTDLRGSDLTGLDPVSVDLAGAVIEPAQAITIVQALGIEVRAPRT